MSDGKICDTVTSCILRLESDTGLTGWGEICSIPHYLPAYANGVAPALTDLAPVIFASDGGYIIPSTAYGIAVNPDLDLLGAPVLELSA